MAIITATPALIKNNELTLRTVDYPVLSIFDNTAALPAAPAEHDRYIALVTANGWTEKHIYESLSGNWWDFAPYTGMRLYNIADNKMYQFNGTIWLSVIGTGVLQSAQGNIIVEVSNALDEAAAFASGSKIVIRTDLI